MKSKVCLLLILLMTLALSAMAQTSKRKSSKPKPVAQPTAPAPEVNESVSPDRISPAQLKRMLDAKQPVLIIDNRAGSAWLGSLVKIKGAIHIPLSDLESRFDELPRDVEIVTYCT